MLEMKETDTFELPGCIFLQKIPELGKYWAFDIDKGEHYSLNETSYWILEQFVENLPLKRILSEFLNNFDVDEKEVKKDFNEIIEDFLKEGIIKRRDR